jgi:phosphoserine phosphatase
MDRRELIRVLGSALAVPLLAGLPVEQLEAVGRATHRRVRGRGLGVLDPHQSETVATLAEMIIPQTDTPGARAARVHEFIDLLLGEWFSEEERARFLTGLADVDTKSRDLFGTDFLAATGAQRTALLTGLDAEVAALRRDNARPERHFFHQFKSLTLYGYYTSEIGAAETHYQTIPGSYDPCVELS